MNNMLNLLNTKSEFPVGNALPKETMKEKEKMEDQYLKGVFTENLLQVERERLEQE